MGVRDVLATYQYALAAPVGQIVVEVVGPRDGRLGHAIALEVEAMAALGDLPAEVEAEFAPHRDSSIYFLAFPLDSSRDTGDMLAMGRIIPSSERAGNKSLTDLALIPGWDHHTVPANVPVRGADGSRRFVREVHAVVQAFQAETGCKSLDYVWDVATLAPRQGLSRMENVMVADAVIDAFTQETVRAAARGEITHVTSFNELNAYRFFRKLGYPFTDLLGLPPMSYDSFLTGQAMTAQIGWLTTDTLVDAIRSRGTRHLARLADQLEPVIGLPAPP
jgi:hypothetical protein